VLASAVADAQLLEMLARIHATLEAISDKLDDVSVKLDELATST
jgi:hypothetical protein